MVAIGIVDDQVDDTRETVSQKMEMRMSSPRYLVDVGRACDGDTVDHLCVCAFGAV